MFFPFLSLCSMPCAGIGRSSGAGTDIAVGGRGHFEGGMMARVEKSIKCGEAWGFLLPLRRYQWHCLHCEVCSHNIAKKSAMTLVA